MNYPQPANTINRLLHEGTVIPAHPLALTEQRQLDEFRQRQLTRYYLAAGAGGVAVGVHTTQFEIRKPEVGLLETVLRLASEEIDQYTDAANVIRVAGVVGDSNQAVDEAKIAARYGYHYALLSNGGLPSLSEEELLERARMVASVLPLFGFYLQPAAGGRILSYEFWRAFADIPNVCAIKIAAFNRYQTIDVIRAVCDSPRCDEIAVYTGNDDNIVADMLTTYRFGGVEKKFVGGLLGHFAVWTRKSVELFEKIREHKYTAEQSLTIGASVTDMNAAIFDPANKFAGCIPGIHEVLRRQGLLEGRWCLDPHEELSAGQADEIDRVCQAYPELTDDGFVKRFLKNNMSEHAKG